MNKKRIINMILIMSILMLQIPVVVFAETNYVAQIGTEKYKTLTEAIDAVTDTTPTTIKIINDVINENIFVIGKEEYGNISILKQNITIDLNGHKITKDNSTATGSIFTIIGSGILTIDDSSKEQTGLITSGNSGRMRGFDVARGTLVLKGGTITTSLKDTSWSGGGVNVWKQGEFIMEGGAIKDCKAGKHGGGVNVGTDHTNGSTVTKGIFTMKGGTIKNCSTPSSSGWGGGVSNWTQFIMEGGTIENNTTSNGGGGVTTSADASFIMTGGTIKSNTAKGSSLDSSGGGVCGAGTLKIGGNAIIVDNKWNSITNNFYLRNGNFIELENPLSEMNVGIVMQNSTGKFTKNGIATNIGVFKPDNSDYAVHYNTSGYLELAIGYNIVVTVNDESMGTASANFNKAAVGTQISLTATPKTGYRFVKWESEDVDDVSNGKFEMSNKAITVKAIFEIIKLNTIFNSNGGSEVNSQEIIYGNKIVKPTNPTKENYVFDGWYKDEKLTELFDFDKPIIKNITLYAGWREENSFTYNIIDGNNQNFMIGNIKSYILKIDGNYSLFRSLKIGDLELIKDEDYEVTEGSTIITFTDNGLAKLNTLSKGEYEILVKYSNNEEVKGKLIMQQPIIEENPKTVDNIVLYFIIGSLSLICLVGCSLFLNNRRFN